MYGLERPDFVFDAGGDRGFHLLPFRAAVLLEETVVPLDRGP
jgi:hypothetical protein